MTDDFPGSMIIPILYNGRNHYDLPHEALMRQPYLERGSCQRSACGKIGSKCAKQQRAGHGPARLLVPCKGRKTKAEEARAEENPKP